MKLLLLHDSQNNFLFYSGWRALRDRDSLLGLQSPSGTRRSDQANPEPDQGDRAEAGRGLREDVQGQLFISDGRGRSDYGW